MTATIIHVDFRVKRITAIETAKGRFDRIDPPAVVEPEEDLFKLAASIVAAMPDPGSIVSTPSPASPSFTPAYCDPDNEFRGSNYDTTERLDIADIAKLVRADIKAAKKEGKLPKKGFKVSVRIDRFAGGCSLDVTVKAAPFQVLNPEYLDWEETEEAKHNAWPPVGLERLTPTADAALKLLKGILGSYNRDNSDIQTDYWDVRFYGHVDYDYDLTRAERTAFKAN